MLRHLYTAKHILDSPLDCKEIQPVHSKGDQLWVFFGRNNAIAETPVLWPPHAKSWLIRKDWCWEGLGAGGEGDDRGWDGWIASLTWWMWVWVNSGRWWWTGRPGVLQFMVSQRIRHDWATELNWNIQIFMLTNICIASKSVLVLTTKLKLKLLIYCKETLTHFNIWERKLYINIYIYIYIHTHVYIFYTNFICVCIYQYIHITTI